MFRYDAGVRFICWGLTARQEDSEKKAVVVTDLSKNP